MILSSYRIRVPLTLAMVVTVTTIVISSAIAYQTYLNIAIEQKHSAKQLAHAMEAVLANAIKHDDVWSAYSVLRGPEQRLEKLYPKNKVHMIFTDNKDKIFASNFPKLYQTGEFLSDDNSSKTFTKLSFALHSDDEIIGKLLFEYPKDEFWDRFLEIMISGLWALILTLGLFIPVGWLWGRHLVTPLLTLTKCMEQIGKKDISDLECPLFYASDSEVGQLGKQFQVLISDLKNKKELEHQIVTQERLAAIGRVAAGVAHEINNPLGGLLAMIDTYYIKPVSEREPEYSMKVIERGLKQIHETVSALLIESRIETRALTINDFNDIKTLIEANPDSAYKTINWDFAVDKELPLPATVVRQILLNLSLNAIQATPDDGVISIKINMDEGNLNISISNNGSPILKDDLPHLFEPFYGKKASGSGLGLWVTYQIVIQLKGDISVDSTDEKTVFRVSIPLQEKANLI